MNKETLVAHLLHAHGIEAADDVTTAECETYHRGLHSLFDPLPGHPLGDLAAEVTA